MAVSRYYSVWERDGSRERSPPTDVAWVLFQLGAIWGLSLLLVLVLLRGFPFGFSGFPPTKPPKILNSNLARIKDPKPAKAEVNFRL